MKTLIAGLFMIAGIAGCATPAGQTDATAGMTSSGGMPPPDGSGTWHFSDQWWTNGVHFCEYRQGRNKVINQIEIGERCAPEITSK